MFRNFVRVVGLVGAFLYAVGVQALGLGDVQLNSGLNEPLDAEIKLLNTGDLNATQIIIKLASPEDFARAGAERDFFLTNFKYKTVLNGNGDGVVKISTKEFVREPYLNFLLEAKWPSGKLIREYTLLVDLPVFKSTDTVPRVSQAPAQKNAAPAPSTSQTAQRAPVRKTTPTFTSRDSARAQASDNSGTLVTRRNDTLWKLALEVRPSSSIAPQKVMVAMQALNPDAFIDNNINLLKTGAVLRVPTLEDIERIGSDRAQAAVAEQNARWRSAASEQRQLDATPTRRIPEIAEESDTGRLRLTTSTSSDATGSGGTDSEAAGDGNAAKLLAAEASVEKANAENIELRSKVENLEAELLALKNKLEIRDGALADLQNTVTTPAPVVAEAEPEEAKADVAATKAEAEEAVAEPDPTTPPAATEPAGLLDAILDNPLYVGGLGALALALLGGVFLARRRSDADEGFDVMAEFEAENADADADVALEEAADELESLAEAEEELVEQPQDFSEIELDSLDNEEPVESEMGDPVAEADIYMAYGRFPQAVELLNRALEQEPERADLRVKLVEVHMGAGEQAEAEEQLAYLQNSSDVEALQQAQTLLGQDHATLDATIEQPELMDEFTQMLGENEAGEELSADNDDMVLADAANEEFPGGLSVAEDDDFSSDTPTAEDGLSLNDGFDLELDLDDAVVDASERELESELDGLNLELPESDTELNIESELSELTSDFGLGDTELEIEPELSELTSDFGLGDTELEIEPELSELTLDLGTGDTELEIEPELSELASDLGMDDNEADIESELSELTTDLDTADTELDIESELSELTTDLSTADTELDIESELSELTTDLDTADTEADIESELSELTSDLGTGDTELTADDSANTGAFEPDLDLNVSDQDLVELEDGLTDQPSVDEAHAELDLIDAADETATKIDLARAYIDMGDTEGAKDILGEVLGEAENEQLQEAQELFDRIA